MRHPWHRRELLDAVLVEDQLLQQRRRPEVRDGSELVGGGREREEAGAGPEALEAPDAVVGDVEVLQGPEGRQPQGPEAVAGEGQALEERAGCQVLGRHRRHAVVREAQLPKPRAALQALTGTNGTTPHTDESALLNLAK